jgi:hypothetical protein
MNISVGTHLVVTKSAPSPARAGWARWICARHAGVNSLESGALRGCCCRRFDPQRLDATTSAIIQLQHGLRRVAADQSADRSAHSKELNAGDTRRTCCS